MATCILSRYGVSLFLCSLPLVTAQVYAQVSFVGASSGSGEPGTTVPVAVSLTNNGSTTTALQFTLTFNPAVAAIGSLSDVTTGSLVGANHAVAANLTPNQLRVVISSDNVATLSTNSGVLLDLVFRIPPSAQPGAMTDLVVSDLVVANASGTEIPSIPTNGRIDVVSPGGGTTTTTTGMTTTTVTTSTSTTVTTSTTTPSTTTTTSPTTTTIPPGGSRCDLNGDSQINILDVQLVINRVLVNSNTGDINGDGVTNILDVQLLINIVLGLSSCPAGVSTTTTSVATSTTVTATTSTTVASTTTTTLVSGPCNLFGDDFTDGDVSDWAFGNNATWQAVSGTLQVGSITGGVAIAEHGIPAPNFFRLTVDIEPVSFNGSFYGFESFSNTQRLALAGRTIDGLGAAVFRDTDGILKVAFLGFDVVNNTFVVFNATDFGAVTSLGISWSADGVTLIVNGTPRLSIGPDAFGMTTLAAPSFELLDLYATGSATQMRFDNLCQASPPGSGVAPSTLQPERSNRNATTKRGAGIEKVQLP